MNKFVYPLLALLAGAVQLNLLSAEAMVSTVEDFEPKDTEEQTSQREGAPRLVVLVTVSGLETDLLELTLKESGHIGFLENARFYSTVRHPLFSSDAVASSAILHTGALGISNGVPVRKPLRKMKSGRLEHSRSIFLSTKTTGLGTAESLSPEALTASTIADEIKKATGGAGLVFSISVKPEEAIIAGGANADGVFWVDEMRGDWASGSYYPTKLPWYISKLSSPRVKLSKGLDWRPLHADFEEKYGKWLLSSTRGFFAHSFKRSEPYLNTPLANQEVTEAALAVLESGGIGKDDSTDVLALSYSLGVPGDISPIYPSAEVIDGYYRLEEEIEKLKKRLPKETMLILMGDGMALQPKQASRENRLFYLDKCKALTNMYLDTQNGVKGLVKEITEEGQLYLDDELIKSSKLVKHKLQEEVADFLQEFAGIAYAFPEWELRRNALSASEGPKMLTAINSVLPKDRGDVVFGIQQSYSFAGGSSQGSFPGDKFGAVTSPLVITGWGVEAERIDTPLDLRSVSDAVCHVLRIRPPTP